MKAPADELKKQKDRMDEAEREAIALGYSAVQDKYGKRIGIGQLMPSATEVIDLMLGEESAYRLLSAVAHGHHWAIRPLGFQPVEGQEGNVQVGGVAANRFAKSVSVLGFGYLGIRPARALGIPLWNQCRYFGWELPRLTTTLESAFDKVRANPLVLFWR